MNTVADQSSRKDAEYKLHYSGLSWFCDPDLIWHGDYLSKMAAFYIPDIQHQTVNFGLGHKIADQIPIPERPLSVLPRLTMS
jgi:hypothetical protein